MALFSKLKDNLKEHVIMRNQTTLRVGGVADFFYEAHTINDLIIAVNCALDEKVPFFILGGGSNIIFSDYGFPGLVIKNKTSNIAILKEESQVIVDSGFNLQQFILEATSFGLSGLEFLFGVPGTIGGAVYGNIGTHGQNIGDYVKSATLLISSTNEEGKKEYKIEQKDFSWFEFGYRQSLLKKMSINEKPIILSIRFQLAQNRNEEIIRRINTWKEKRKKSQPIGMSAGCIFKNPIPQDYLNLRGISKNMLDLPKERTAGYLLDKAGAKKLKSGDARVSTTHANFILNKKNAKAMEIRSLIEEMRRLVLEKNNISLEEEIEYVGQW